MTMSIARWEPAIKEFGPLRELGMRKSDTGKWVSYATYQAESAVWTEAMAQARKALVAASSVISCGCGGDYGRCRDCEAIEKSVRAAISALGPQ